MSAEPPSYRRTGRTSLRRAPQRGRYDKASVHAILDANALCQIAYLADGQPAVLPTIYWRTGDRVFWHGSRRSGALVAMAGAQVCFCVARLDGLVLARSAFRHSANYLSVMAFGVAREVEDEAAKLEALEAMIGKLYPGRWAQIRPPDPAELAAVSVLWMDLDEVSAKQRSGPPQDLERDLALPVWAGVAPIELRPGRLEPDQGTGPVASAATPLVDWTALGSTGG
jgi:nitroimidazol reductase NimA-like FMN-containing flavoprotein (pyridoxamine 5'-phosphate oxidase superfamily)